jgi:hypothetical protein
MKKYEIAEMDIVKFNAEDVITTSSGNEEGKNDEENMTPIG